jgi:hypothetical protein
MTELTIQELISRLAKKIVTHTNDNPGAVKCLVASNHRAVLNNKGEIEIQDDAALAHPEHMSQLLAYKGFPPKQLFLHLPRSRVVYSCSS